MTRYLAFSFGCLILALFQTSFIASLPQPWHWFDLTLSLVVFLSFLKNSRWLWLALVIFGLVFELHSAYLFGLILFIFLVIGFVIRLLYVNVLTNRSLMAFLTTGVIAVWLYDLLVRLFSWLTFRSLPDIEPILRNLFWHILLTLLAIMAWYGGQKLYYKRYPAKAYG